jgi:hypothetical protein
MSKPELPLEPAERQRPYLEEVLEHHPELPLGVADISHRVSEAEVAEELNEPGYALDQTPSWLAAVQSTYDLIGEKPILGADLGTSTPRQPARLRMHSFERVGARGRDLGRWLRSDEAIRLMLRDSEKLKLVSDAVSGLEKSQTDILDDLLSSAIQKVLFTITTAESKLVKNRPSEQLKQRLKSCISNQRVIYVEHHGNHETRFEQVDQGMTYLEAISALEIPSPLARLSKLLLASSQNGEDINRTTARHDKIPAGLELANQYIDWQVNRLAHIIGGNPRYKPARFFSMDKADPRDIAISSIRKTPYQVASSGVFSHAIKSLEDPRQHIQGSLFEELPFPDNSLATITCFDAWPFHFQLDEDLHTNHEDYGEVALQTLLGWYQKLAYGGKIVVFPWTVKTTNYLDAKASERVLKAVTVQLAKELNHTVSIDLIHRDTLAGYMMSPTDFETSQGGLSILAAPNEYFEVLVINKPLKRSLKNREKRIAERRHPGVFSEAEVI